MTFQSNQSSANRQGIILLVVLGSLTFFSILIAAYLVFSNESREASFALSQQEIREPDVDWMMNEALMKLVRGTDNPNDPFYGEDLLSDYYGVKDGRRMRVKFGSPITEANGFIGIPAAAPVGFTRQSLGLKQVDDALTGLLITFREGPLRNQTFRVLRSRYHYDQGPAFDRIYIDLASSGLAGNLQDPSYLLDLFINKEESKGYEIWVNGSPRNTYGISASGGGGYASVPPALQPNIGDKGASILSGDFDEGYDAPDFNNWFLSHRREDGTIIPSFHRPAVLNYLLNETPDWSQAGQADYDAFVKALNKATFRPLPISSPHRRFTGGSPEFALRAPLQINNPGLLNQLMKSLIKGEKGWDVDNDSDGVADSVWVDLGLPAFTTREGKIVRPLVAPMIEDLSSRLNLNAHGNIALSPATLDSGRQGRTTTAWPIDAQSPTLYRGLGWGPAEITLPIDSSAVFDDLLRGRYQNGDIFGRGNMQLPGSSNITLDTLRFGFRPPTHTRNNGFGYSCDPFGRGLIGIGRSGHLLADRSGTRWNTLVDETVNDPYELDPTGRLGGDQGYSLADLESILRGSDFDSELLPDDLRRKLKQVLPQLRNSLTTISVSDDGPPTFNGVNPASTLLSSWIDFLAPPVLDDTLRQKLISLTPPEFRLGRKLDVNRGIGNGIDDTAPGNFGFGVVDEPKELESPQNVFGTADNRRVAPYAAPGNRQSYLFDEQSKYREVGPRQLLARHLYLLMMAISGDHLLPTSAEDNRPDFLNQQPFDPQLYKARRLAQWAVNVVDYRDPDSIMTRFVFDPAPFDINSPGPEAGWYAPDSEAIPAPAEYVVWGVEEPHLLFSESLAFHDVRIRDTSDDPSEKTIDPEDDDADRNTDQIRIPQGSLFLELYCPQPVINVINGDQETDQETKPGAPAELFAVAPNGVATLDLDRMAPDGTPVWRIALSEPHFNGVLGQDDMPSNKEQVSPAVLRGERPGGSGFGELKNTLSFEADFPDELGTIKPKIDVVTGQIEQPLEYDRFILFTNQEAAVSGMDSRRIFFAPSGVASGVNDAAGGRSLEAGSFLVLAPRKNTFLGSKALGGTFPGSPSNQKFEVNNDNTFTQIDKIPRIPPEVISTPTRPYVEPAKTLVIATKAPPAAVGQNWEDVFGDNFVGLNISEPLPRFGSYYPLPSHQLDSGNEYTLFDSYVEYEDQQRRNGNALDEPLDLDNRRIRNNGVEPTLGTQSNQCSAFLQRLANPLKPYHKDTNPYRTVDWLAIDLNVFSGEERPGNRGENPTYASRSRQKNGYVRDPSDYDQKVRANALFSYETNSDEFETLRHGLDNAAEDFFRLAIGNFRTSLGFLNTTWREPGHVNIGFDGFEPTLGSASTLDILELPDPMGANDVNLPSTPYAIHPWLNRPFASHLEVLMVPACSQGRLFEEFSFYVNQDAHVSPKPNGGDDPLEVNEVYTGAFRHLLNFFHSVNDNDNTNHPPLNFVRLFDFIHTLPRFRGEVDVIPPSRLSNTNSFLRGLLSPPFGVEYDNKRVGKINLNTLSESAVWVNLMNGHLNQSDFGNDNDAQLAYNQFINKRRGYRPALPQVVTTTPPERKYNYDPVNLNPDFPTEFVGVFRSAMGGSQPGYLGNSRPIDGTLLRDQQVYLNRTSRSGDSRPQDSQPLFVRSLNQLPYSSAHDRSRNAFMRYQTLMRMPNLVSDNSQVFLIRMTLGLFEVDARTGGLGREYNADSGTSERYNAMFIVDRSIPVGFEPGKDLNTRDVVVFESYGQ